MRERMRPRRKSANMLASSNRQTETPSPLGAGVFYWSPQDACGQRRYGLYTASKKAGQPHFAEGRIRRSPSFIPYKTAPFRRYSPLNRDGRRSLSNNAQGAEHGKSSRLKKNPASFFWFPSVHPVFSPMPFF